MKYLIALLGLMSLLGCGEPKTEADAGAGAQPAESHVLKSHEDSLQRAKDAAKALEQAGVRTETAIEKSISD